MKWFDNFIQRCYNRARGYDELMPVEVSPQRKGWGRKGNNTAVRSNGPNVQANYDDRSVIGFKVYGANGGMIVETTRYDDKLDTERVSRYVISEEADVSESLGKIVTMEYMR